MKDKMIKLKNINKRKLRHRCRQTIKEIFKDCQKQGVVNGTPTKQYAFIDNGSKILVVAHADTVYGKYKKFKYKRFDIDIDLKHSNSDLGTYTQKLANNKRLQFTGPLWEPWYFIYAEK